jgi:type III pantothenate kinase
MLLTLDLGNTKIKASVFEEFTFFESFVFDNENLFKEIQIILNKYPLIQFFVVSSVLDFNFESLKAYFQGISIHVVNHKTQFPFVNLYTTPNTLGIDRLVVASGAVFEFPKKNRLIIDVGTCITYDFVDENDRYFGGAISPGINMRYKSLHDYTAKLPLLSRKESDYFIGNSTENSIHSGIINAIAFELDGFINLYKNEFTDLTVILTGGDGDFLAKRLKNIIFADNNFLAQSLCAIFHNVLSYDKKDIL